MRKTIHYVLLLLAVVLAGSCRRQELPSRKEYIKVNVGNGMTKGLLGSADLNTTGTRVAVVDYLTGFEGTFDGASGDLVYFDDAVVYGSGAWNFVSGSLWQWTRTGTHNFFGWLEEDAISGLNSNVYGTSSDRVRFDRTTKAFTIPSITFTKDTPQFDLCYSDWVSVNTASRTSNDVILPLHHAFMGLSVYITNKSADRITIQSVQFNNGFKNTKAASHTYGNSSITYSGEASSSFLASTYADPVLSKDKRINLITGAQISSTVAPSDVYLMWPQTAEEVEATQIHVEYTIDGIVDPSNPSQLLVLSKDLNLKEANLKDDSGNALPMVAGRKYALELLFRDKEIKLELVVLPWDMDYTDTSYSSSAIVAKGDAEMEGVLWLWNWNTTTSTWDAGPRSRSITLTNGKVQGRFFIESPTSGEWQIDVYPASAAQYFIVEPMNGIIEDLVDGSGNFEGRVLFEVRPNPALQPPSTQELHFNVNIRIGGQWRNANTEFNRKDWKLYLNP